MRAWRSISCFLLSALAAWPCAAEEKFPYTAYVNADDVYVRSGPGQTYYPTAKMALGQAVEVYRHDPGGWYAIRPPEGSFSWVATRYLKMGRDKIAVVNGDRVVARVGSSFSDIREVIQVRLERGEEVEILDTKVLDAAQGGEKWAKVAPVSGEFRWVLGKFLDRTPPEAKVAASRNANPSWTVAKPSAEDEPANRETALESTDGAKVGFRPIRSAGEPDSRSTARPASFGRTEPAKNEPENGPALPVNKPKPGNTVKAADFQAEIDQIDLEISQMVAEEPSVWAFDDLRTRAETALARAQTAVERGRARLVLNKVQRFQEIKDRFQRVGATAPAIPPTSPPPTTTAAATSPNAQPAAGVAAQATAAQNPSQYAGAGRLTSVVSFRLNSPHFALVDDAGGVRAYVTPAPGVNLRPFLGRQVGVSGAKTFMPEFNAQHVTAQQITPLERTAMR